MHVPVKTVALLAALAVLPLSSCSVKQLAINSIASSLADTGDVFASDNDPELVRDAIPFALKTMEALLSGSPKNRNLLLAACRGFAQYSYAFVQADADIAAADDYARAEALRQRALKLYLRARDYGIRGLETRYAGIGEALKTDPSGASARIGAKDVDLLYWTAASWGAAISLGKDRPELLADVSAVRSLMRRGMELNETYDGGAFHEAMIDIESLPAMMGGSPDRARQHFERALELSRGLRASTYITLAMDLAVQNQDRKEFEDLLAKALAVDPDRDPGNRLANIIAQRSARALLAREDELFLDSENP